ncbi:MAG: hypothetical protein K1060chlam2_01265 [Chlamydiae bacterium]|nr:hypothetical protein [Chlamydiota bacterium]
MKNRELSLSAQTFKYWEIFLSWLFKYPSRCYELKQRMRSNVLENPSEEFYQFAKSYRKRSASKGIICRVTSHYKDIERVSALLHLIYSTIPNPELCELAACEVMAKVMAYRNLKEEHTIPFPIMGRDGCMQMSLYSVDRVFDLWSKVRAFGLVCVEGDGAPLLLYRGTDFSFLTEGGRASIISDLDPKGPGRTLFEQAEKPLKEWLGRQRKKTRVIGHSLGGVILAYTLLHESEFISQERHETSFAFNFPGVRKDLVDKWDQKSEKPRFRGYICRGDVISKFGMLFGEIYEVSLKKPLSPVRAHEQLLFAEPHCTLREVDLKEENRSSSRQFYSRLQEQTSSMIYEFGLKFLFPRK